jgi:hypothetical protein
MTKADQERKDYNLMENIDYLLAYSYYAEALDKKKEKFGSYGINTVSNKNMIKALRMSKWNNDADDWARLHVYEKYMRSK